MADEEHLNDQEMELFSEFLNLEEDKRAFELLAGETGFSPEDIERVFTEVRMFVSARIMRTWESEGSSPKKVRINLSLDLT